MDGRSWKERLLEQKGEGEEGQSGDHPRPLLPCGEKRGGARVRTVIAAAATGGEPGRGA